MKTKSILLILAAITLISPVALPAAAAETSPALVLLVPDVETNCSCVASLLDPQQSSYSETIDKVNTVQVSIVWNYEEPIDGRCKKPQGCPGPAVPCKIKFSFTMQVASTLPSGAEISGGTAPVGIVVAGQSTSWKDTAESACEESPTPKTGTSGRIEHEVSLGGSQQVVIRFDPGVHCGKCGEEQNNG